MGMPAALMRLTPACSRAAEYARGSRYRLTPGPKEWPPGMEATDEVPVLDGLGHLVEELAWRDQLLVALWAPVGCAGTGTGTPP